MPETLITRIARQIMADFLISGDLNEGDRLPSVRDLQERYGVSNATVSYALSVLQEQGTVRKEHGRGCFVARTPKAHPAHSVNMVGLVFPCRPSWELMMNSYAGVEQVARAAGYEVIVINSRGEYERERTELTRLAQMGCRGAIVYPTPRRDGQQANDYLNHELLDFPVVLMDLSLPYQQRSQVVFDNRRAGYQMTRHLLDQGHRRIAFMELLNEAGDLWHPANHQRLLGYRRALKEAGIEAPDSWRWPLLANATGFAADPAKQVAEWLTQWQHDSDRVTAIITLEDNTLSTVFNMATGLGIDVPGDLTLAGFDDLLQAHTIPAPFPTTCPDFELAGETAMELLIRHMEGELATPTIYMLPAEVKMGGSHGHHTRLEPAGAMAASTANQEL